MRRLVTCKLANPICPWTIHASPMLDGVTYKTKSYNGQHIYLYKGDKEC